jgi:rhamnose transport system ATP-binding protein
VNPPSPVLETRAIGKTYDGVHALKDVSFDLLPGEVHALIGENGAGKSTLIKIMTGALQADSGILLVDGRVIAHNNPPAARALGIAAIYQQPALFPHLSVAENIALALENGSALRAVNWKARRSRARDLLENIGAAIDPERPAASLSMPEQQLVEIAKALGANARILIMDEPTASLTQRDAENLFRLIRNLRARGTAILYISHRLEEISAIADRVTVLRDGAAVITRQMSEVDRSELIRLMVGREITSVFPKRPVPIGEVVFELRGASSRARGLRDISLSLKSGEILGLAGLVGSGRTELAESIFGLTPFDAGELLLHGAPVRLASPEDALRHRIAYVPEDRRRHGVILDLPLTANTTLANLDAVSRHGWIARSSERALASRWVRQLDIKTSSVDAPAATLSGGNQQKVALARWLTIDPTVLILDEPTQGVDVASKAEIHKLMVDLAERGLAILMISSELPEILDMSDRIAVMQSGTIRGVLSREEATQDKILALALEPQPC